MLEPLWTAKEVAAYLNVSRQTVYNCTLDGRLPGLRVGGLWRYEPAAVRAYARGEAPPASTVVPFGPRR